MVKLQRNDLCHCGSGLKYKKCCLFEDQKEQNPLHLIENASKYPIEKCWIRESWEQDGLANILIVRKNPKTGKFLFAMVLADTYCLGVKNAMANADVDKEVIEQIIKFHPYQMIETDYEYCRGIILGSIDFAKNIGFEPHKDWQYAKEFVEPDKSYRTIHKFGKNGKPFYIPGPDDDFEKILEILRMN